jgi:hypothetical protein
MSKGRITTFRHYDQVMAITKKKISSNPSLPTAPAREREFDEPVSEIDDVLDSIVNEAKEFSVLDPGKYEAIIQHIKQEQTEKGIRVVVTYAVYTDENPCWKHLQFFQLTDADCRTPNEWGPVFFARFMGKLGYEKGNRGPKSWEEVNNDQPGVILKITPSKQEGFVNTQIEGTLDNENENIQEIRKELESSPF